MLQLRPDGCSVVGAIGPSFVGTLVSAGFAVSAAAQYAFSLRVFWASFYEK
jgi:hypothetical protein